MSQLELVACITDENKRRRKIMQMYFEMPCLALAYLSSHRSPRNVGCFNYEEEKVAFRKYILKNTYDGSKVPCYDKKRLTKRNFHGLLCYVV
jgi:hypothetical protein